MQYLGLQTYNNEDGNMINRTTVLRQNTNGQDVSEVKVTKQLKNADGLLLDADNQATWIDSGFKLNYAAAGKYTLSLKYTILDDAPAGSQTALLQMANLDSLQTDKRYRLAINLQQTAAGYKPILILERQQEGGTYKKISYSFDKAFKERKNRLTYHIYIDDFEQNEVNVVMENNKKVYDGEKGLTRSIDTGNYAGQITGAINILGDNNMNDLPLTLYDIKYTSDSYTNKFVFKDALTQPVSENKMATMSYSAIPNSNRALSEATRTYENNTGDKRYELANHLGNVLSVITDQKLLNIDRGIPVLDARFDQTGNISPFQPTPQVGSVQGDSHWLSVTCDKKGEGVYPILTIRARFFDKI